MNSWLFPLLLMVVSPSGQFAEPQADEWGVQGQYQHLFNPKTLQTQQGQILKIEPFSPGNRMCNGLHLVVRTSVQELSVHLGPQWYIEDQQITLHYGMQVSVRGSMIQFEGAPAMIATEVITEDGILRLRTDDGSPLWSARQAATTAHALYSRALQQRAACVAAAPRTP